MRRTRHVHSWSLFCAATLVVACTGMVGTPGGGGPGITGSGNAGAGMPSGAGGSGVVTGGAGSGDVTGGAGSGVVTGGGGSNAANCAPGLRATSQIARLSNDQYDRTVYDLLGIQALKGQNNVSPSTILATDQAAGLTDIAWSSYKTVAELIITQVMADPALKSKFMPCTPTGDGKACLHDTIVKFGRKAFRRPLTAEETARFDALVTNGAMITPAGTTDEIAGTILYMFLISPSFLQRAEITETTDGAGRFLLSSHEVASRLSYMLWGSIPDDALDQAADANQLATPAQILAQAQRMVKLPQARGRISDFHRFYVLMGPNTRWDNANHDTTMFPAFKPTLISQLMQETELFFDNVAFAKSGTFQDLILSPVAFVNSATAPLYGLPASGFTTDFKETQLDPAERPGFLTRVGFLGAYSYFNRTSPIHRGAFITKQVLGTAIGTPPPGAEATALPTGANLDTNRKQVDAQTTGGACEACHHGFINPAGFAMEAFNAVGTWQTTEGVNKAAIDTTADVVMDGKPVHVTGPADLMAKIAASPMAQRRYAERWVSFAYEREGDPLDCGTVNELATKIAPGGYTVFNLITDLTQSPSFRLRAMETN